MSAAAMDIRAAIPRPAPEAIEIRCPSIETARSIREDYGAFCHYDERDLRFRTVWLVEDTPEYYVERVRARVERDRQEDEQRFGQADLTDAERGRLQQRTDWTYGTHGFHARSCKAIAVGLDVDDWTAHYDHELTVDEHRDIYRAVSGRGGRNVTNRSQRTPSNATRYLPDGGEDA
ncbi:hypothetical protein [Halobaculum sp. EA56]|uniref:hypothetical protein n=1 Tax=Halobaculum sp. EA56 TaxID=3421648 RepID=UPI003EBA7B55